MDLGPGFIPVFRFEPMRLQTRGFKFADDDGTENIHHPGTKTVLMVSSRVQTSGLIVSSRHGVGGGVGGAESQQRASRANQLSGVITMLQCADRPADWDFICSATRGHDGSRRFEGGGQRKATDWKEKLTGGASI
ncbi:Hypothetical protein SMAX5B_001424 [Scophthalmus maximus]|uniref:Uncharacterized protein n=1 Tax=Scophthalmus maximus TaxID=52904 RepID=A0A2U9B6T7_SCOMX|nr:Hypothetical protein SMAX5B_001424 [Scophthalmus maximus]